MTAITVKLTSVGCPTPAGHSSFEDLQAKAAKGDIQAQYEVGQAFYNRSECAKAKGWLEKAALKQHALALMTLGTIYRDGRLGKIDRVKAQQLYEAARKQGHPEASNKLGLMYELGHVTGSSEYEKAQGLFKEAIVRGSNAASWNLLQLEISTQDGWPETEDDPTPSTMRRYLTEVEELHQSHDLTDTICSQIGVLAQEKNFFDSACKWFKRAKEKGNSDVDENLAAIEKERLKTTALQEFLPRKRPTWRARDQVTSEQLRARMASRNLQGQTSQKAASSNSNGEALRVLDRSRVSVLKNGDAGTSRNEGSVHLQDRGHLSAAGASFTPGAGMRTQTQTEARYEKEERKQQQAVEDPPDGDDAVARKEIPKRDIDKVLAAAEALKGVDLNAWKLVKERAEQLDRMFARDTKIHLSDSEMTHIRNNPLLNTYYCYFARHLTGTWLACQTINSEMVKDHRSFTADKIAQGLKRIGDHIPLISVATDLLESIVGSWNAREKREGVQRISRLFPDLKTALRDLGTLARHATLSQESIIKRADSESAIEEGLRNAIASAMADDADDKVKRKAIKDCKSVIGAIIDKRPRENPTVADLLTIVVPRESVRSLKVPAMPQGAGVPRATPLLSSKSKSDEDTLKYSDRDVDEMIRRAEIRIMEKVKVDSMKSEKDMQKSFQQLLEPVKKQLEEIAKKDGGGHRIVDGNNTALVVVDPPNDHNPLHHPEFQIIFNELHNKVGAMLNVTQEHQGKIESLEASQKS